MAPPNAERRTPNGERQTQIRVQSPEKCVKGSKGFGFISGDDDSDQNRTNLITFLWKL